MSAADPRPPGGGLPRELADAARALRAEVPVRDEWRNAVLREAESLPAPQREAGADDRWWRRPLVLHPAAGLAAAAVCVALGVVAGRLAPPRDEGTRAAARADSGSAAARDADAPMVRFVLVAPGASRVSVVGDFNRWSATATPMRAAGDGRTWVAQLPLTPGRHVYAFVVDGDLVADPAAPRAVDDDYGIPNSVVLVGRPSR